MVTTMLAVVWPTAKLTVPLVAVKSEPAVAVLLAVVNAALDTPVVSPVRVTVKVTVPAFSQPLHLRS